MRNNDLKSKERIQKYGEIFTPKWLVQNMLNSELKELIINLSNNILEPAVGEGVFLIEILKIRLENVLSENDNMNDFMQELLLSVSSMYGIDVLEDNVIICINNLYELCIEFYEKGISKFQIQHKDLSFCEKIKDIIKNNIIQKDFLECPNVFNRKFNLIIGNPPYQKNIILDNEKGNRALSRQLYPAFVIEAINLKPDYLSFVIPARWYAGEGQDKSFIKLRNFIKRNNRIKEMHFYPNSNDIFKNVIIRGGICYFLYDNNYDDENMKFVTYKKEIKDETHRPLFLLSTNIIIADKFKVEILNKILSSNFTPITSITTGRNPFGIDGKRTKLEKITSDKAFDGAVELRCSKNETRYIDKKYVKRNIDLCFNKYKVFISKSANGSLDDLKILGTPYVGRLNVACTDSLITIGSFETIEEVCNLQKYIMTKFLRYVVSTLKVSQNVHQNVYAFVPMQDFTNESDIDWNKPIDEIDDQLFKKYKLNDEMKNNIKISIKYLTNQ